MIDADVTPFRETFDKLHRVFRLRGEAHEIQEVMRSYFAAMRKFPLSAVLLGADAWMAQGKFFPKPAEWIASIPKRSASPDLPQMSPDDIATLKRAGAMGFEDEPCKCFECRRAGVDHRYLRFVPNEDRDGNVIRQMVDGKLETPGRWIHGEELRRWYVAKERFWADFRKMAGIRSVTPVAI